MAREQDHKNLTVTSAGAPFDPRDPGGVRAKLEGLITELGSVSNRRGGTIYIPRVPNGQLWIDVTTPLRIPRDITLSLAPGVVLVPTIVGVAASDDDHHLEIEGVLAAPVATIFATPGWFSRHNPPSATRHGVGVVRLSSPHLERVYPEWWGAGDARDAGRPSDNEALDAAVRAAVRDRLRREDTRRPPLRPLAVELRGTYTLDRTLRITAETLDVDRGLTLQGVFADEDTPTLRCAQNFPPDVPMLLIEDMKAITLEDVRFEGEERAETCLQIVDRSNDFFLAPAADRAHLLRRCGFHGARGTLVSYAITDFAGTLPPIEAMTPRIEGLHVEHCAFRPQAFLPQPGAALGLLGPPSLHVDVRGCTFRGEAAAMIHALGCSFGVASCHFHNGLFPTLAYDAPSEDALHANAPAGGVDLYLDRLPRQNTATVYAQSCRSTSPQFLVTRGGASGTTGNVTVVGLHYTRGPGVGVRRAPNFVHEDRPRWFRDVFEMTPIAPRQQGASKLPLLSKVLAPKQPVGAPIEPLGVSTELPPRMLLDERKTVRRKDDGKDIVILGEGDGEKGLVHGVFALERETIPFAPILWRFSGEHAGRLILMGCRFDFPDLDTSSSVRGTPGASAIIDLGVLRGDGRVNQISVDASTGRVEVPTWPHRP